MRYSLTVKGAISRAVGIILPATAEVEHVYPYRSERLWFVQLGESVLAVMAVTSDDAWNQIWSLEKPVRYYNGLTGLQEQIGVSIPITSGDYLGISRAPATETSVVICPHGKVEVYCSICDEEARAELRKPFLVKP